MKLRIGSLVLDNRFILAPMAGITNLPFRIIAKRFGAALVTTEMISAKGIFFSGEKTKKMYLAHTEEEDPTCFQLFGSDPEIMAKATEVVIESGAKAVDINMGCPVKKVVKTGAGGALLKDLKKAEEIIKAVRKASSVPVTIKIRAGWSRESYVAEDVAKMAEDLGVDAITVHPRFVVQGFSGKADWEIIKKVKQKVSIPVIGNGDVFSAEDAIRMLKQTGCDAVMIARGAIGNPWIFRDAISLEKGERPEKITLSERKAVMFEHLDLVIRFMGEKRAVPYMRGMFMWYTKNLPYSRRLRERIAKAKEKDEMIDLLNEYFSFLEEKCEGKDSKDSRFLHGS